MTPDPDDQLRAAFQAQQRHDERHAPAFAAILARPAPKRTWTRVVPAVSALALAACVLLALQITTRRGSAPVAAAVAPAATMAPAVTASVAPTPPPTPAEQALAAKRELGLTKQQIDALTALGKAPPAPNQTAQVERILTRGQRARWHATHDAGAP